MAININLLLSEAGWEKPTALSFKEDSNDKVVQPRLKQVLSRKGIAYSLSGCS